MDITSINAKLKLGTPDVLLSERHVPFGYFIQQREEWERGELFKFLLDDRAIAKIEKHRKGDIRFHIELQIVASLMTEFHFSDQRMIRGGDGSIVDSCNLQFSIPRSIWIEKILPDLGHQSFRLVEIPLGHKQLKEAYSDIIFEFNKAEDYFNQTDYNKCVAHCRNTLDALTRNLKKIKERKPSESSFKWLEGIDKATFSWIDELNKTNSAISSKSHHSGQKKEFTRHEAESIYLVILGLLNLIGHIK
ncbi:MAG: hypothetical protein IT233_12700 [Bacteroidia bacterium]|nr:hypothetical protein [Bacteroidia bacterium]